MRCCRGTWNHWVWCKVSFHLAEGVFWQGRGLAARHGLCGLEAFSRFLARSQVLAASGLCLQRFGPPNTKADSRLFVAVIAAAREGRPKSIRWELMGKREERDLFVHAVGDSSMECPPSKPLHATLIQNPHVHSLCHLRGRRSYSKPPPKPGKTKKRGRW